MAPYLQCPSQEWRDTQHLEDVSGAGHSGHSLRLTQSGQVLGYRVEGGHRIERRGLAPPVAEVARCCTAPLVASVHSAVIEPEDAIWITVLERLEQHAVDQAEDGGVGSDADGQYQHHER